MSYDTPYPSALPFPITFHHHAGLMRPVPAPRFGRIMVEFVREYRAETCPLETDIKTAGSCEKRDCVHD